MLYCSANQEGQLRTILFAIVKQNNNFYTPLELTRIDRFALAAVAAAAVVVGATAAVATAL